MSQSVVEVENLGKQYRLGQVGTGTMIHDLNRWWYRLRRKEDPYLKLGEENDRTISGNSDLVWVLKNLNFEIKKGEIIGIIGRNGAGKSTLLKLLSRVTSPTTGEIRIRGRIASLLEVGTGFHPDLTGRENVFLNGAILGMTKSEINPKFDEIVSFSGVERYIDTPVKRYSSGMYVRLAFAVAAHLEPEILIIDEVLAVGDAEFQQKCLGKMREVGNEGRTVLFVSHNMEAIKNLTQRSIVLSKGQIVFDGETSSAINQYLKNNSLNNKLEFENSDSAIGNEFIRIKSVSVSSNSNTLRVDEEFNIEFKFWNSSDYEEVNVCFDLYHVSGINVFSTSSLFKTNLNQINTVYCRIPPNLLNNDIYSINLMFFSKGIMPLFSKNEIISFEIEDTIRPHNHTGKINGVIRPELIWKKEEI